MLISPSTISTAGQVTLASRREQHCHRRITEGPVLSTALRRLCRFLPFAVLLLAAGAPPAFAADYVYDVNGRVVAVVQSDGSSVTYRYDAVGNMTMISKSAQPVVSILSAAPLAGPPGTEVRLSGTYFDSVPANNVVAINGVKAVVSSASLRNLTLVVPAGASTGKISVSNSRGNAISAGDFVVEGSKVPVMTSFSPTIGAAGTSITILGANFQAIKGDNVVEIGARPVNLLTAAAGTVQVTSGQSSGKISLATRYGKAVSSGDFHVLPAGYAAGDISSTGRIAVNGAAVAVSIGSTGKKGMLLFDGLAAQRLALGYSGLTSVPANQTIYYRVYSPTGAMIASGGWPNASVGRLPVLPVSGTYTMIVDAPGASSAALSMLLSADLTGTLTRDAPATTVNFARLGQKARYTFTGAAGDRSTLSLSNGTFATATSITIYKPDGTALDTVKSVTAAAEFDLPDLPVSGTYSVDIDPPNTAATGKIDVRWKGQPADLAATITINGAALPLSLAVHQRGKVTFTGTAGQRLGIAYTALATTPAGSSVTFTLTKPDGTQLFSDFWSSPNSNNWPVLPVSGTYTLLVVPPVTSSSNVTLLLSSDVTGTLVRDAASSPITIARAGQNASYAFNGNAGEKSTLVFSGGTFGPSVAVTVYKPDGTTLTSISMGSSASLDLPALPVNGSFRVFIDPGIATGKVDMQLKTVPNDLAAAITIDGAALPLSLAVHQRGAVTFTGTAGQRLGVGYSALATTPAGSSVTFTLNKPDGTQLFSDFWSSPNSNNWPVLPVTGTYTLLVVPPVTSSSSVTLLLSSDVTGGTLVRDAAAASITIARAGQNGSYAFNGNAGEKLTLVSSGGTFASSVAVTVYKPDGTTLTSTSMSSSASFDLPALPVNGSYRVFIDPGIATGKIDMQLKTVPADLAAAITINGAALPLSLAVHQRGAVTFTGTAGQMLGVGYSALATTPAGSSVTFTLNKPDGTQLFSDYWSSPNSNNWPVLPLSGTYTLLVVPPVTSSSNVTLLLSSDVTGTLVPGAAALNFQVSRVGQNARLTFAGTAAQVRSLEFSGGTFSSSVAVTVLKPDGSILASGSVSAAATLSLPALPVSGNYTVVIDPSATTTGQVNVQLR